MEIYYKIITINGDYALAEGANGTTNIAIALLPPEVNDGDIVLFKDFEYIIIKQ